MSCWSRACPLECGFAAGRRGSRSKLGPRLGSGEALRVLRWGSWVVALGKGSALAVEAWFAEALAVVAAWVVEVDVAVPVHPSRHRYRTVDRLLVRPLHRPCLRLTPVVLQLWLG